MNEPVKNRVVIVDYGLGNLLSIRTACQFVGLKEVLVTPDIRQILSADAVILPGVGAFGEAMAALKRLDLVAPLKDVIGSNKTVFGICLGLQLLMNVSYEFGEHEGLGIIQGRVRRFENSAQDRRIKIPHVGWAQVYEGNTKMRGSLLDGMNSGTFMYFTHSYYVDPEDKALVLSNTTYEGIDFCSSIQKGNLFACQFHPEKSGKDGIQIFRNFSKLLHKSVD